MGKFGACPECGRLIARDLSRCPYCRAELAPGAVTEQPAGDQDASRKWEPPERRSAPPTEEIPVKRAAAAPSSARPSHGDLSRYRPISSFGSALQLMFAAWMGLLGLVAAGRLVAWRASDRLASNPFAVSYEQASAADQRAVVLGVVGIGAYAVTGLLFVTWLWRAYRNLTAFQQAPTRFRPGWAIGAWFVPILNLVRPKRIVDECWRESAPRPTDGPRLARTGSVPWVFHLWWGLTITGRFLGSWFWLGSPDQPGLFRWRALLTVVAAFAEMGAAGAAFWVVTLVTRRQAARAASLGLEKTPRPVSRPAAVLVIVGLPLVAAAATVPALVAWHEPPAFVVIGGLDPEQEQRYEAHGVGFRYPGGYVAAESSGFGSGKPTYGYGMIALTPETPALRDHYLVVEWASGLTTDDAAEFIAAVVDMVTRTESGSPLRRLSDLVHLPFGSGEVVARTFSASEGGAWMSGAVGYGMCPSSDRLFGIRYIYPYANRQGTVLGDLEAVLASLSC